MSYTGSSKGLSPSKLLVFAVSTIAIICAIFVAVRNYYYPYKVLNDTLREMPYIIYKVDGFIGFIVMLCFPILFLMLLLNAGLSLSNCFSRNRLVFHLASMGLLVMSFTYCSKHFLDAID